MDNSEQGKFTDTESMPRDDSERIEKERQEYLDEQVNPILDLQIEQNKEAKREINE